MTNKTLRERRLYYRRITTVSSISILILTTLIVYLLRFSIFNSHYAAKINRLEREISLLEQAKQTTTDADNITEVTQSAGSKTSQIKPAEAETETAKAGIGDFEDLETQKMIDKFFGPLPEKVGDGKFELPKVRGIYVYNLNHLDYYFDLIKNTPINTFVIDIKESWGVLYDSQVPLVKEMDAVINPVNLKAVIDRCHEQGIRVVGRMVCFKDTVMAEKRPDLCIQDKNGNPLHFPLDGGNVFASPYNPTVWKYLADIATEAIGFGLDEIQLDYVRFPSGSPEEDAEPYFGEPDVTPERHQALNRFLQTISILVQHNQKTPVGADLFSIVMTSEMDGEAIGQRWSTIGLNGLSNICPMIYPSHYANSSNTYTGNGVGSYIGDEFFEKPDFEPYAVVKNAIIDGDRNIDRAEFSTLRPYIQAFTAEYLPDGYYINYGTEEIQQQINALADQGIDQWFLWNAGETYPSLNVESHDLDNAK